VKTANVVLKECPRGYYLTIGPERHWFSSYENAKKEAKKAFDAGLRTVIESVPEAP